MNPTVKNILIISLKNAVNALLTNGALAVALPSVFNAHEGWWTLLKLVGSTVLARESMIWGPKLLKWSQSE